MKTDEMCSSTTYISGSNMSRLHFIILIFTVAASVMITIAFTATIII